LEAVAAGSPGNDETLADEELGERAQYEHCQVEQTRDSSVDERRRSSKSLGHDALPPQD
jgi:hypothetical protein